MKLKMLLIGLSLFSSFSYSKVNPSLSINEDSVCPIFADAYGDQMGTGKAPNFWTYQKFIKIENQGTGVWGWINVNPNGQLTTPMEFISPLIHQDIKWQKWQPAPELKYRFMRRGKVKYGMGYGVLIGTIKPAPDQSMVIETFSSSKLNADRFIVSIIDDTALDSALAAMQDENIIKSSSPILEGYYPINLGDVVLTSPDNYTFQNIFQYNNNFYTLDKNGVYKINEYGSRTVCQIGNGLSLDSSQLTTFEDVANKSLLTKAETKYSGYYGLGYSSNRQVTNGFKDAIEKPMLIKVNKNGTCFKGEEVDLCRRNYNVDNILSELASQDPWSYREVQAIREHAKSVKYVLSQFYIKQLKVTETTGKGMANQAVYNFLAKIVGFHPTMEYSIKSKKFPKVKEIDLYTLDDPAGSIAQNHIIKTELMWAAHFNDYDAVQRLLEKANSSSQKTKLVNAVTSAEEYSSVRRLNRSALTYALENATFPVIKALLDAGADINIEDSDGNDLTYYMDKNNVLNFSLEEMMAIPADEITPSFDCKRASTIQEKAICASKGLAVYDKQMSMLYSAVNKQITDPQIKVLQKRWLKERDATCSMKNPLQLSACMKSHYRTRIKYFNNLLAVDNDNYWDY